jgi:hypothetical protein
MWMSTVVASMNTRKDPTFEELWTFCAQGESKISTKEKIQRKDDDQAYATKFKKFRNKKKFDSRKKPNQEKDMSKVQCFNFRKYGHYKNHYPKLKKRKETHEATVPEEKEPSKKVKQDEAHFFFKVTIFFCNIVLVHTMFTWFLYTYFLEDKMVNETTPMEE